MFMKDYYYCFTPCEFFTPALVVGLSRESEWQPVFFDGVLFCLYSLSLSRYLLRLSCFNNIFWFIYLSCAVILFYIILFIPAYHRASFILQLFSSLARFKYIYLSFRFHFYFVISCKSKIYQNASNSFLLILSGWSVCMSISQGYVSFSWTDSGLCIYHLAVWSNFNLLHSSLRITFPTQS